MVLLVVVVCVWLRCAVCVVRRLENDSGKTRMWIPTRLRVCFLNFPVCTGNRSTTRVRRWQQLKSIVKWSQDSVTQRGCKFPSSFFDDEDDEYVIEART